MNKDSGKGALGWRIGEGWDTHALVAGRRLVLGGVEIAHSHGLAGHSDADALCHAITDALFGAAALGDIGHHFPDTDAQFEGADRWRCWPGGAARARRRLRIGTSTHGHRPGAAPGAAHCGHASASPRTGLGSIGQREGQDGRAMGPVGAAGDRGARAPWMQQLPGPPTRLRAKARSRFTVPRMCDAATVPALPAQAAAHALHGLLDDGQAQPGAGGRGACRVAAEEGRGQVGELLGRHARPVVAHRDHCPGPAARVADLDLGHAAALGRAVAARVLEQVGEHAPEFGLVGHDLGVDGHARVDADLRRVAKRGDLAVDLRRFTGTRASPGRA
jgi:hypothetical protein